VSNSAISYCTNGLYLYGSNPSIYNNNIHNNTYGIYLLSSSPNIYDNFIQNNTAQGINCSASSNPAVGNGSGAGNNFNQNNYGVFCWNNSAPNLGYNSTGYNDLTNTNYNVYNMSSNGIYAMNNYWGDTNPTNFKIAGISSVVITGYKSSSQYVPTPPLNKTSSNIYASDTVSIPLLSELDKANQYIASNNLVQARVICLNLINNFPDNCVSFNALNLLKETFPANQIDSVKNLYKSIFNRNIKKKINAIAGLVLAEIDTVNRLFLLDNVISSYARDSVLELALFDKFICYYFDKSDKQNALSVLTKLDNMFPLSQGDIEAHQILGDENYYGMDVNKKQTLPNSAVQTITGYTLNDNYPNPFNPSTIISWQLAAGSFVTLKVYDVLGKEVKTLVNERQEAGTHSISFDGSTLSSGVYFYQLRAGSFLWTKKMLLTK
jgi:hypothetical protein